jgi:hypothetical protein
MKTFFCYIQSSLLVLFASIICITVNYAQSAGDEDLNWKVSYTGDLTGEVKGTTLVANKSFLGGYSIAAQNMEGERIASTLSKYGEEYGLLLFNIDLGDQTECSAFVMPEEKKISVDHEVLSDEEGKLHVRYTGKMKCGEAVIDIDGFIKQ